MFKAVPPLDERFTMFTPEDAQEYFSDPANDYTAEETTQTLGDIMAEINKAAESFLNYLDSIIEKGE